MSRLTLAIAGRTLFGADTGALVGKPATRWRRRPACSKWPSCRSLPSSTFFRCRTYEAPRRTGGVDRLLSGIIDRRRRDGRDTQTICCRCCSRAQDEKVHRGMSDQQLRDELMTTSARRPRNDRERSRVDVVSHGPAPGVRGAAARRTRRRARGASADGRRCAGVELHTHGLRRSDAFVSAGLAARSHGNRGPRRTRLSCAVQVRWWSSVPGRFTATNPTFRTRSDSIRIGGFPSVKPARPRFSYFPFGGGSRGCMGEAFAWMEGCYSDCGPRTTMAVSLDRRINGSRAAACDHAEAESTAFAFGSRPRVASKTFLLKSRPLAP